MRQIFNSIAHEHSLWLVALAGVICLCGCALTMRLFARLRAARGGEYLLQLGLTGVIGGATIWTTHFVAMVAYEPNVVHAYEPVMTVISLLVAVGGVTASLAVASMTQRGWFAELGGAFLGLSVSVMYYLGMEAFQAPGRIVWDKTLVISSVVLGVGFGALALNRVVRPFGRFCRYGGVLSLTLAICMMHFTGMSAIEIVYDPTLPPPMRMLSDTTLIFLVVAVMSLFLLVGLSALLIETKIEERAAESYEHATQHDALTGLPNRLYLDRVLERQETKLRREPHSRVAILTMDLDRFKEINDMHGHHAGDEILRSVARRIRDTMGAGEFAARAGGDEFIAVKTGFARVEEVQAFAERLVAQIVEPVRVGAAELAVGVSIGVACYPEHGRDSETLLTNSDLAMYRSKENQLDSVCVFDADMDLLNRERLELTHDLRQALLLDQFELHYQLQNDVQTREPVGFEVLLRWNHPVRGQISPGAFIPLAEKSGLIRSIGLWVLQTACAEAANWTQPLRVAVNVAPQQLVQPTFVEHVAAALRVSGLDPRRLELEITEASIIDDKRNTLDVMHRLKALGVRIAMDDFGTGYSSLASLRAFPFDKIKIDRSFVDGVHENPQNAAIVRSTLLLGGALEIPVLAEGVEQETELDFLSAEQCSEVQGFYFGKPMRVEDAREIVGVRPEDDAKTPESDAA